MTHDETLRLFEKTLGNLGQWMDKATEHAAAKSFETTVLVQARLAPDQFCFAQQVQAACDQLKYAAAYLGAQDAPSHPDTEETFAELGERIAKALQFAATVGPKELEGSAERKVAPAWLGGAWLTGDDYVNHVAVPNFFFHVTSAYSILRHNGVALGKQDFVGSLPIRTE